MDREHQKKIIEGNLSEKPQQREFPNRPEKDPNHLIDVIRTKIIKEKSLVR
jgi:hypothetical protein